MSLSFVQPLPFFSEVLISDYLASVLSAQTPDEKPNTHSIEYEPVASANCSSH